MKFDNVMVPVDGSTLSEVAVDLAIHSGGVFATHLTFLFVVDLVECNKFGNVDPMMEAFKMKAEGKFCLERAAKLAEKAGIPYDTIMEEGNPWEIITEMSKEKDMMIMGVTGKSGMGSGRVGHTAEKVIENSYCPVLTIRSGSRKLETILLPVSNKNMGAIDIAIETCKKINGTLTVFSVRSKNYDANELVKEVSEKCSEAGINVLAEVGEGDVVEAIVSKSGMYDLVIMGTEGRSGLKKILNGSVAERVMTNASCPVTIVRDF